MALTRKSPCSEHLADHLCEFMDSGRAHRKPRSIRRSLAPHGRESIAARLEGSALIEERQPPLEAVTHRQDLSHLSVRLGHSRRQLYKLPFGVFQPRGQGGQVIQKRHALRIELLDRFTQVSLLLPDLPDFRGRGALGAGDVIKAMCVTLSGRRSAAQRTIVIATKREQKAGLLKGLKAFHVRLVDLLKLSEAVEVHLYLVETLSRLAHRQSSTNQFSQRIAPISRSRH